MKYRTRKPSAPPYHWLFNALYHHCKRDEKKLSLTFEEFLTFITVTQCHYCGSKIHWPSCSRYRDENGKLLRHRSAFQLDRKDNDREYSLSNCVVCCSRCNSIKGETLTYDEMLMLRDGLHKVVKESGFEPASTT